jgi:hypothetical protein
MEWDQQWHCLSKTRQGAIGFLIRPGISTVSATTACSRQHAFLISVKQSVSADNLYFYSCITVSKLQMFSRRTAHFALASK